MSLIVLLQIAFGSAFSTGSCMDSIALALDQTSNADDAIENLAWSCQKCSQGCADTMCAEATKSATDAATLATLDVKATNSSCKGTTPACSAEILGATASLEAVGNWVTTMISDCKQGAGTRCMSDWWNASSLVDKARGMMEKAVEDCK